MIIKNSDNNIKLQFNKEIFKNKLKSLFQFPKMPQRFKALHVVQLNKLVDPLFT